MSAGASSRTWQRWAAWEPGSSEPAAGGGGVVQVGSSSVGAPAAPGAAEPEGPSNGTRGEPGKGALSHGW